MFSMYRSYSFAEVRNYVREGLPHGHWLRSTAGLDSSDDVETCVMWQDSIRDTYATYPSHVRDAARFRDGMVLDKDVYSEFDNDFGYTHWAQEYKKQSEIVFEWLFEAAPFRDKPLCSEEEHSHDDDDPNNAILCNLSSFEVNLMAYHADHVEGYQSQVYMREKILALLQDDIDKLPKTRPKKEPSNKSKVKYLHALCVIILTLSSNRFWLGWKFYGIEDFRELFSAIEHIDTTLRALIKYNYFDNPHRSKTFLVLLNHIKNIDKLSDHLRESSVLDSVKDNRFFKTFFITKSSDHALFLKGKYGDLPSDEESEEEEVESEKEGKKDEEDAIAPLALEPNLATKPLTPTDDATGNKRKIDNMK